MKKTLGIDAGNTIRFWAKLCSVIVLFYFLAGPTIDRSICYARISQKLGVASDITSIWWALHKELNENIKDGFTYDQTFSILKKDFSPYEIIWENPDIEGGFKTYVSLEVCHFSRNNFTFLFYFSTDKKLTDIINYVED